jgi:L-fucose mutarotase/ribose pyranase (RbsD/FucU family)
VLIGIDPVLGPDCLALLRAMGHGDEVVLADTTPYCLAWRPSTELGPSDDQRARTISARG